MDGFLALGTALERHSARRTRVTPITARLHKASDRSLQVAHGHVLRKHLPPRLCVKLFPIPIHDGSVRRICLVSYRYSHST